MSESHFGKDLPFDFSSHQLGEDWKNARVPKKKNKNLRADSLQSSSMFAQMMEIFMWLLYFISAEWLCYS